MKQTIAEYVALHAEQTPEKKAVITPESSISFRELIQTANAYACFLQNHGLKPQDIVVTKAANTIEYAVLYLGVHLSGGVICSLEKSSPPVNVRSVADSMKARIVIDSDLPQAEDGCTVLKRDVIRQAEEYRSRGMLPFPNAEDSADILFTTGTTGASKGVELSHKALTATAENLICGCGYDPEMLLIVPGPLNHANAIRKLFTSWVNGNTVFLLNGLTNVKHFFDALDLPYKHTACCLPPAMIRLLLTVAKEKLGEYADKISFIESASAPLPEADRQRLGLLLPYTRLIINYGSSEAASVTMYDCNQYPGKVNCIGRPMPNAEILIVDDQMNMIQSSAEQLGLIACKGDVNMKGYVNDPELTREVLRDGIVYTNDIGYMDEEGFVYIIGRKGDVINVGGMKVAPTEVEDAALQFAAIEDCICIAESDRISGNIPKLLYVSEQQLNPQELKAFLAERLENYKIPRHFEKVDHIARTYNGKLDRKYYRNN